MESRIDEIFNYVQERYLWQFFSRTWDREENINSIISLAEKIFLGVSYTSETPAERCFEADAKVLVTDFRRSFPWINEVDGDDIKRLLDGLKDKLVDITITHSRNRELNHRAY